MRKIVTIIAAFLIGTCAYAQKNTLSENIGVVIPIGDVEIENNPSLSLGLSYQRDFTPNIGLITSLNVGFFKYDEYILNETLQDYIDYTGASFATGEATGSRIYNFGIGISEGLEFGNSGFFFEGHEQLVLGLYNDPELTINNITVESESDFQIGGKFGIQIYKMFGGFGLGLNADYTIGTPHVYFGSLVQYANIQLKLVQKF